MPHNPALERTRRKWRVLAMRSAWRAAQRERYAAFDAVRHSLLDDIRQPESFGGKVGGLMAS